MAAELARVPVARLLSSDWTNRRAERLSRRGHEAHHEEGTLHDAHHHHQIRGLRGRSRRARARSQPRPTTGARIPTVTPYDRDLYGMLPAAGGWYTTIRQEARAAAKIAEIC